MSTLTRYDLIVIGAGPAGYVAAIRAAQLGFNVACIEKRDALGGTCLNVGCIPSKALLDSSEHFLYARTKLSKHGVKIENVTLDLETMMKRKDTVVRQLTQGIDGIFKKNKITRLLGTGALKGKSGGQFTVEISGKDAATIEAPRVLLATGSEPSTLPSLPMDGKKIISSTEALALTSVPKHMVVVGAGVIGLEMGSVWNRLGSKVTVLEYQTQFLPTCDSAVSKELFRALQKQGLEFRMGAKVKGAKIQGDFVVIEADVLDADGKPGTLKLECDVVLVAAGRRAYTQQLGLESVGLAVDKRGCVEIDEHFQTKVPGVFAIGDLVRGPMLAHKAEEEGVAIAEIMAGQAGHVNYDAIPNVIYTWPELATVGATEEELKARGVAVKVGTFPFLANGRAKAMDEPEGLVKIIADATTDRVLGVHIVGARASDMIAEAVSVMEFGGSAEDIARTCHAHPTLSEIVKEAALAVDGRRIHL